MKKYVFNILILILGLLHMQAHAEHATITNGYNVTNVIYANTAGQRLGVFEQTNSNNWTEYAEQINQQFHFIEQNRDEWSVYLFDASRQMHIQLDLHRKKVIFQQDSNPRRDLYDIVQVNENASYEVDAAVDNYNEQHHGPVRDRVRYELADSSVTTLKNLGNNTWQEKSSQHGEKFHFTEHFRNEFEVYLYDASRDVNAYINFKNNHIYYKKGKSQDWEYYYVLKQPRSHQHHSTHQQDPSRPAQLNGYNVARVVLVASGRPPSEISKSGEKQWTQYTRNSSEISYLTELGRDQWNVYLLEMHDSGRRLQLDLLNNKVWVTRKNGKRIDKYQIIRSEL